MEGSLWVFGWSLRSVVGRAHRGGSWERTSILGCED